MAYKKAVEYSVTYKVLRYFTRNATYREPSIDRAKHVARQYERGKVVTTYLLINTSTKKTKRFKKEAKRDAAYDRLQ